MKKFITNPYFKKGLPGDNGIDPVSTDVEAVKKLLSLCPKAAETPLAESAKLSHELGINKFDTGVNYGNWKTQPLLGLVLKEHIKKNREELVITSKAGTQNNGSKNFSPDYIEHMINKSISDMQCKYLDKFYLHGPTLKEIETKGLLKKLISLGNCR